MAFELSMLIRMIHILAGAIWFGSALFMALMIAPVARAPGPAGGAFMAAAMRRGGFGRFFGPAAATTVIFGIILYGLLGYTNPFADARTTLLALGAIAGLFAFFEGLAVTLPTENKIKRLVKEMGPQGPTPDQQKTLQALGEKMSKAGARGAILIGLGFVLMLARTLV